MHPILFEVGGHAVHTYGVLLGSGLFGGIALGAWLGRRDGMKADWFWDIGILIVISSIIGARLEYVRTRWEWFVEHPGQILTLADGGLVFYGGLIGAMLAVVAYALFRGLPLRRVFDVYAAPIPLGHALGRVGCVAAGCCYGAPTDLPWAITYPEGSAAPAGVPVHPVQLYEAGFDAILGVSLLLIPGLRPGRRFAAFLVLYPAFRAFNELFRGDQVRGFVGAISNAQAISLVLGALGLVLWFSAPGTGTTARSTR